MDLPGRVAPPTYAVVFVISNLGGGGAQRVLTTIANSLAASDYNVAVITVADVPADSFHLHPMIHRVTLGRAQRRTSILSRLKANLASLARLRRAIRSLDAPLNVAFIAPTNIIVVLAALGMRRRVVICERNDPSRQSFGFVWDMLRRWVYPRASLVTANSRGAAESLKAFVPESKVVFLPNPVPHPIDSEHGELRQRVVLTVGRLVRQKGHDVLIDAFASIAARHRDWTLDLVGQGKLQEDLERQADRLQLAGCVRFRGFAANPYENYRTASIFVLASRFEGTPNALVEAMSCGLAIITTRSAGGALDFVIPGETGLVVPTDDPAALADALQLLMDDDQLRARLGEAGRARVLDAASEWQGPWSRVLGIDPACLVAGGELQKTASIPVANEMDTVDRKDAEKRLDRRSVPGKAVEH